MTTMRLLRCFIAATASAVAILVAPACAITTLQTGNSFGSGPQHQSPQIEQERTTTAPSLAASTKLEPIKTQKAVYPASAIRNRIQGQVWLRVLVSEAGDVEDTKVISGDPDLADAAVAAVKNWKFKPFIQSGKSVKAVSKLIVDFRLDGKNMDEGVSTFHWAVQANPQGASADRTSANRIRLLPRMTEGMLVHQVAPVYPDSARWNHVQGEVVLQAVIGKDGKLAGLTPISGRVELVQAAMDAVRQWRYRPYMLNGEAVEVETVITVNFTLAP